MALDLSAAVLPAKQMPGLTIFVNKQEFQLGDFLVIEAPGEFL